MRPPRPHSTSLLTSLALLATAPLTASQGQWPNEELRPCIPKQAPDGVIDWSTLSAAYGESADFGRVITGDFTGNLAVDAVVHAGTKAVMLYQPASYEIPLVVGGLTNPLTDPADIATWVGEGPGRGDAILATNPAGLSAYRLNGDSWVPDPYPDSAWADAAPLYSSDFDADGDHDVVGVKGLQVLLAQNTGSGLSATSQFTLSATPTPTKIVDLTPIDWDDDGDEELAFLTDVGIHVRNLLGDVVYDDTSFAATYDGAIARIELTNFSTREYLVWARDAVGTPPELHFVNGIDGSFYVGPLNFDMCQLGSKNVRPDALLVGDYDDDDEDDLIIVHDQYRTMIALVNQGPVNSYFQPSNQNTLDVINLDANPAYPLNMGLPAFAQIDESGPDDFILPLRDENRVEIYLDLPYFYGWIGTQVFLVSGQIARDESEFTPGVSESGELRFAFEVPEPYRTQYDWILVTLFEEIDGQYPSPYPVAKSIYRLEEVQGGGQAKRYQYVKLFGMVPGSFWTNPRRYYYTAYRFVNYNGATQNIINQSSEFHGGLTLEESPPPHSTNFPGPPCNGCFYSHLWNNGNVGKAYGLFLDGGVTAPSEGGGDAYFGAYVPTTDGAPFEDGVLPDPYNETPQASENIWGYIPGVWE